MRPQATHCPGGTLRPYCLVQYLTFPTRAHVRGSYSTLRSHDSSRSVRQSPVSEHRQREPSNGFGVANARSCGEP